MGTKTLMTAEEFSRMITSETEDYELVEGELIPLPSANPTHADVRGLLEQLLRNYFDGHPVGRVFAEVDCRLGEATVRRPDLAILLAGNVSGIDRKKVPMPFSPDIAVEVISPSETFVDVRRKALEYLAAGSHEVWLLDFDNGEVGIQTSGDIRLLRGDAVLETPLLPGFSATVSTLLAGF